MSEANRFRLEPLLADYTFYRMRAEFSRQIGGARGWLLLGFQYVTRILRPNKIAQGADATRAKKHREIEERRTSEIAQKDRGRLEIAGARSDAHGHYDVAVTRRLVRYGAKLAGGLFVF